MANILPPVEFATITGRFMVAGNDSVDPGGEADIIPAKGKGTISPSVGHVLVAGSTPPATIKLATVDFEIDSEGYISDAKTKERDVQVVAPSEAVNPSAFTYRINFDGGLFPGFDFHVVPGSTIDLTNVGRVATSVGVAVTRGEPGVGIESMTLSPDQSSLVVIYDNLSEQAVEIPALGEIAQQAQATTDEVIAAALADPDSATRAAGNATYEALGAAEQAVLDAVVVDFIGGTAARDENPNVMLGGARNGSGFASDTYGSVILNPGQTFGGSNNIIGGDGTSTVNTPNLNVTSPGTTAHISVVGGYDNVAGQISSKIISDHSYTEPAPTGEIAGGHSAIFGGANHKIRWTARHAMIAAGRGLDVSGSYSLTSGDANVNGGTGSLVAGIGNTVATSIGNTVTGEGHTVGASYTDVSGWRNTADPSANLAVMRGARGRARSPHVHVMASGRNAVDGDAQTVEAQYRVRTTTATPALMVAAYTGAGAGSQFKMLQGQVVLLDARVVAREDGGAGATVGVWTLEGAVEWRTGQAAPVWLGEGQKATTIYAQEGVGVQFLLGAGGSAGTIYLQATGKAATTINWSSYFRSVEVI